jgi:L-asparaginase
MAEAHITIATTGGTIDKDYGQGIGITNFHIGPPFAMTYLPPLYKGRVIFHHKEVMRKDSTEMSEADHVKIAHVCRESSTREIIVTHGTDRLLVTAAVMHEMGIDQKNFIVLTGALRPAAMKVSDAESNLKLAVEACLRRDRRGIFVAIGQEIQAWDRCAKDPKTGHFLALSYSAIASARAS